MIRPKAETLKLNREYNARVKVWLKEPGNADCKAAVKCFGARATQAHHKFGRGWTGELTMVEKHWIPICQACHYFIHFQSPDKARELGLLANRGEWNNPPA